MVGYWFIWCNLIVIILFSFGYKRILLQYVSTREMFVYFLLSYILISYNSLVLYTLNSNMQFHIGILYVLVPLAFILMRDRLKSMLFICLSSGLLALLYCLVYVLFILHRGYEPAMYEWLILVCFIVIMLMFVIPRDNLFFTVLLTKLFGDILLFLHQQGQVNVKIGDFSWWEFVIYLWISSLFIYESVIFIAKNIKLLRLS